MRKTMLRKNILNWLIGSAFLANILFAQQYNKELSFEGINQVTQHSAAARAAGNISIGAQKDIALMFQNPATLISLESIHVSLGGMYSSNSSSQRQNFAPVRYFPNLSLLLEQRTDQIPDPPPDSSIFAFGTLIDTVQRPNDDIRPGWSKSGNDNLPVQAMLAVPLLNSENYKLAAGLGAVEYANVDHYYQNNNVLSPDVLSQRPLPTPRPTDDNPIDVEWLQQVRSRSGSIQGYGFALAGSLEKYNLSVGFSGMFLDGSSDDYEQEIGRGDLTFYSNAFRADSLYRSTIKSGTSDFSGQEFTLSSTLHGEFVSIGFSLKPPATITRKYTTQMVTDSAGTLQSSKIKGEDKLELGWRGVIGISITPKDNIRLGIEYDFRPYESVRYIDSDKNKTSPWLPAFLFRVGVEYMAMPWLTLRGGMRGEAEVFQPEGNHLEGEPVTYTVYSAGAGFSFAGAYLNIAYENSLKKYQDIWSSAISKNKERSHVIIADLSYEIPWGF